MSSEEVSACQGPEPVCNRVPVFCGVAPDIGDDDDQVDGPGARAVVVRNKIWTGRQTLRVFFINKIPDGWRFDGHQLTTYEILKWANTWNPDNNDDVPIFVETTAQKKGDIRVKFCENEGCWSMVGMYAERIHSPDPTMVLNLCESFCNQGADQRSLVIHEFGHALGLEHEHQRSDFWRVLEGHLDFEKMSDDPRVSYSESGKRMATFGKDWFKKKYGSFNGVKKFFGVKTKREEERLEKSDYDPDSIMHYAFDLDWLKDPRHRNIRQLDMAGLTEEEKRYIKGIHKRHGSLATDPSDTDISSLKDAYKTRAFN